MRLLDFIALAVCVAPVGCTALRASPPASASPSIEGDGALIAAAEHGARDDDAVRLAFDRLDASCRTADLDSCVLLGRMHQHGLSVPVSPARALALYISACSGGSQAGCTELGKAYLSGMAGYGDEERGAALLSSSCFDGHAPACVELSVLCGQVGAHAEVVGRGCALVHPAPMPEALAHARSAR